MGDFKIKEIKNYMMTGISYLIPVCIIGGMFSQFRLGLAASMSRTRGS